MSKIKTAVKIGISMAYDAAELGACLFVAKDIYKKHCDHVDDCSCNNAVDYLECLAASFLSGSVITFIGDTIKNAVIYSL